MSFSPIFDFEVFVNGPKNTRNRVNPENCLLPNSAFQLMQILGQNGYPCKIVPGPPLGAFGDVFAAPFAFSGPVTWFEFTKKDGTPAYERAGAVAAFWDRATNTDTGEVDEKTALRNALVDVKNVIEGN